jgi:hypothetical protein
MSGKGSKYTVELVLTAPFLRDWLRDRVQHDAGDLALWTKRGHSGGLSLSTLRKRVQDAADRAGVEVNLCELRRHEAPDKDDSTDALDEFDLVSDLPTVEMEFTIDVPPEIAELARERFERARERRDLPDGVTLEDYLMDHINLDWSFNLGDDDR